MSKLDLEALMTIKTLARQRVAQREIARMLGISEGTVRYQIRRMAAEVGDGRSAQPMRAESVAEADAHCHEQPLLLEAVKKGEITR
jgi:IS30 family transposase